MAVKCFTPCHGLRTRGLTGHHTAGERGRGPVRRLGAVRYDPLFLMTIGRILQCLGDDVRPAADACMAGDAADVDDCAAAAAGQMWQARAHAQERGIEDTCGDLPPALITDSSRVVAVVSRVAGHLLPELCAPGGIFATS